MRLPDIAEPHLKELSPQVGESTSASVLDGDDIVYIARVQTRRIMAVGIAVGTRFPAYATSMGRAMLAGAARDGARRLPRARRAGPTHALTVTDAGELRDELAKVRRQGWALVDQELEMGLRSVAAPVADGTGAWSRP